MGASKKEQCFEKAVERINDGRKARGLDPLRVEHQQGWIKDYETSQWAPGGWTRKLYYSIRKTLRITAKKADPRDDGAANPIQYRRPDVTVTRDDGSKVVIDNKFTNKQGNPDPWGTGGMSGSHQQQDYREVNEQQGNDVGEPKLDKNVCDCGKRKLETEKVQVRVPSMQPGNQMYFMPEGEAPPVRVPRLPPVRIPIRVPVPVIP